jgi:putative ABC transport system permease protein
MVVVLGETVRRQLFGTDNPIGQQVRLNGFWFEVIGVFAPKGANANGNDQDDTIALPWTTAMLRIVGRDVTWLDDIYCSAASQKDVDLATATTSRSAATTTSTSATPRSSPRRA